MAGEYCSLNVLKAAARAVAAADRVYLCSQSPATWLSASTTHNLGTGTITPYDNVNLGTSSESSDHYSALYGVAGAVESATDPSAVDAYLTLTISMNSAVITVPTITAADCTHIALGNHSNEEVLEVFSVESGSVQTLNSGNSVALADMTIVFAQPTAS